MQPGFEMSFCATASLVALAEVWPRQPRADRPALAARLPAARPRLAGRALHGQLRRRRGDRAVRDPALQPRRQLRRLRQPDRRLRRQRGDDAGAGAWRCCWRLGRPRRSPRRRCSSPAGRPGRSSRSATSSPPRRARRSPASSAPQIALVVSYLGIVFVCLWRGWLRWLGAAAGRRRGAVAAAAGAGRLDRRPTATTRRSLSRARRWR